jgi:predicted lipoprotein with Yx(FWY)xxD motif
VRFGVVAVGAILVLTSTVNTASATGRNTALTIVGVVQTRWGPVLSTGSGRTLYAFVDDLLTSAPSACTGDCANDWIPMPARGRIVVRPGVTGRVGTVVRNDGERQLTMDRRPLYTFSGDRSRGEIRGNGVGNLWWAMTPSGLTATAYPSTPSTYGPAGATTLTVVRTRVGSVVANDRGQVLYTYADDTPTQSACNADWCLVDWPPLQASGAPTKPPSISAPVAVIRGAGGTEQVTLAGHPLYTFAGDLHPGDARGQGIGGDWFLISPDGLSVQRLAGSDGGRSTAGRDTARGSG